MRKTSYTSKREHSANADGRRHALKPGLARLPVLDDCPVPAGQTNSSAALGGIEAGGTKWVCAVGAGPSEIRASITIPTTTPEETISRAAEFLRANGPLSAVGVGSFGPLDLNQDSAHWGEITTTPKPGWAGTPLHTHLAERLGVPIALDTDVNAAALGEHCWGAARGFDTFSYLTVGTGIGAGSLVHGELLHGLVHPEVGHLLIPHDRERDPFDGVCPFHRDCFEGLASGEAMRRRWGKPGPQIEHAAAWDLEAEYVALGVLNMTCVLSPQRIILGGGVMQHQSLIGQIREKFVHLAAGFLATPALDERVDSYLVSPALGNRSGVVGALELARRLCP